MQIATSMAHLQDNSTVPSRPVSAVEKFRRYVAGIFITAIVALFAAAVIAFIAAKFWIFFTHLSQ